MSDLRRIGREGEDRAAQYLLGLGYTIVTRRYTARLGEIDLVALDGDELVFVEVKVRNTADYRAEEAVGPKKVLRLRRAADAYLLDAGEVGRQHRFDLVAIEDGQIRHHPNAFIG